MQDPEVAASPSVKARIEQSSRKFGSVAVISVDVIGVETVSWPQGVKNRITEFVEPRATAIVAEAGLK